MATPSHKDESFENFLINTLGYDRRASIINDVCVMCGKDATTFRDNLSRKEYTISGMCQACQDSVFGK